MPGEYARAYAWLNRLKLLAGKHFPGYRPAPFPLSARPGLVVVREAN